MTPLAWIRSLFVSRKASLPPSSPPAAPLAHVEPEKAAASDERPNKRDAQLERRLHASEAREAESRKRVAAAEARAHDAEERVREAEAAARRAEQDTTHKAADDARASARIKDLETKLAEVQTRLHETEALLKDAEAMVRSKPSAVVEPQAGASHGGVAEAHFSPGETCLQSIRAQFARARKTVDVCVFTITDDRIAGFVLDAHRRGVKVRIITDNDKALDEGSDIGRLARAGVPVRQDLTEYHMHHKFAVFDQKVMLTGSYNWTRGAANFNAENIVVTDEPRLLKAFGAQFEELWAKYAIV